MRLDWNLMKGLKIDSMAHARILCLLMMTLFIFGRMPAQAAPIIDTTMAQTTYMPGISTAPSASAQDVTNVQIVSGPGSTSTQMTSIPGGGNGQEVGTAGSTAAQTVQTPGMADTYTSISTGASGVGELWMLGSATGAQNLSIVIKSPHGKLIVIDGGWAL